MITTVHDIKLVLIDKSSNKKINKIFFSMVLQNCDDFSCTQFSQGSCTAYMNDSFIRLCVHGKFKAY